MPQAVFVQRNSILATMPKNFVLSVVSTPSSSLHPQSRTDKIPLEYIVCPITRRYYTPLDEQCKQEIDVETEEHFKKASNATKTVITMVLYQTTLETEGYQQVALLESE